MKRLALLSVCGSLLLLWGPWLTLPRTEASQSPSSAVKPPVYVYDFELDVAPPGSTTQTPGSVQQLPPNVTIDGQAFANQQPRNKPLDPEQEKRKHASELVNWMSAGLIAELQKAGYSASRLHAGDGRPDSGVAIRGIFTEIDPENHWRRAVIRSADDSGKMQAVVSVANLAKPDQAMYEIAPLPGNEAKPGAVITLSPYVPLTKYDLDKKADQPALQVIAARAVKDMTALLTANPAALTQ